VHEQQRNGSLDLTLLMYKMYRQGIEPISLNLSRELRQFVQHGLLLPPIEIQQPVMYQTADIVERRTVVPSCIFELVRELSEGELVLELVDFGVRDGDFEGFNGRHCCLRVGK
jgi:hypothetical protein